MAVTINVVLCHFSQPETLKAMFTLQANVAQSIFFFFGPHVTQICFCHDSVNSTNCMESDLFDPDLCHFHMWY